jgi:hypothetical protein
MSSQSEFEKYQDELINIVTELKGRDLTIDEVNYDGYVCNIVRSYKNYIKSHFEKSGMCTFKTTREDLFDLGIKLFGGYPHIIYDGKLRYTTFQLDNKKTIILIEIKKIR